MYSINFIAVNFKDKTDAQHQKHTKKHYSNVICPVVDDTTWWAFSTLWSSVTFGAFRYSTYYTLRALTVLSALQWSSACQGPCGRLCVSSVPGSDQARRDNPGYVWMGSSCCQPAVQELQDPGPHHWHWIPSVHWLLLSFPFFCPFLPSLLIFLILISANPHFLFRPSLVISSLPNPLVHFSPCSARPRWGSPAEVKVRWGKVRGF